MTSSKSSNIPKVADVYLQGLGAISGLGATVTMAAMFTEIADPAVVRGEYADAPPETWPNLSRMAVRRLLFMSGAVFMWISVLVFFSQLYNATKEAKETGNDPQLVTNHREGEQMREGALVDGNMRTASSQAKNSSDGKATEDAGPEGPAKEPSRMKSVLKGLSIFLSRGNLLSLLVAVAELTILFLIALFLLMFAAASYVPGMGLAVVVFFASVLGGCLLGVFGYLIIWGVIFWCRRPKLRRHR